MSSAGKTLLFSLIFSLFFLSFSTPTFAAASVEGEQVNSANYGGPQNSNYALENLLTSTMCVGGFQPVGTKCLSNAFVPNNPSGQPQSFLFKNNPGGALGSLGNLTMALYTPPTSSAEYLADLGQNLGLIEPVYAQVPGSGSNMIRPVFALWQVMRNLSYILFILVFIIVGFMIMFRQKLNPQTVISVQTALPGLVIGLILVTFSYFIAALITDVAFYAVPLVAEIFIQTGAPNAVANSPAAIRTAANDSNIFSLFPTFRMPIGSVDSTGTIASTISSILSSTVTPGGNSSNPVFISNILAGLGVGIPLLFINPVLALGGGAIAGVGLPYVISSLVPVILMIALFIQLFRTFLKLLSAYITILVSTITGPLVILGSSLPGKGGSLSTWWKTILANALVFPAVFGAILFAGFILASVGDPTLWTSPPPLFGGLTPGVIPLLISYGILLGTAQVPDMVKGAFGIKDSSFGTAALAGFLGGVAVGRSGVNRGWNATGIPDIRTAERRDRVDRLRTTIFGRRGDDPRRYYDPGTGTEVSFGGTAGTPGIGQTAYGGATNLAGRIARRIVGGR